MIITSTQNQQVRQLVSLQKKSRERELQGVFLVEGRNMYEEIPPQWLLRTYMTEPVLKEYRQSGRLRGDEVIVSDQVFRTISDTRTPQGVLCVVRRPDYSLDELLRGGSDGRSAPLLMILERIQDPGNLGTILRSAEAAGVTGVILSGDCADIYNPKTVRSTMGSIFRVPFCSVQDLAGTLKILQQRKVTLFAAYLQGSVSYDSCDYSMPCGFLIGNEGNGLTGEIAEMADYRIRIPMCGRVESLNAGMAATILVYEAFRQRRCRAKTI